MNWKNPVASWHYSRTKLAERVMRIRGTQTCPKCGETVENIKAMIPGECKSCGNAYFWYTEKRDNGYVYLYIIWEEE